MSHRDTYCKHSIASLQQSMRQANVKNAPVGRNLCACVRAIRSKTKNMQRSIDQRTNDAIDKNKLHCRIQFPAEFQWFTRHQLLMLRLDASQTDISDEPLGIALHRFQTTDRTPKQGYVFVLKCLRLAI